MDRRSSSRERDHLKRGDIYIVSLEPTVGHEQQGLRPVMIVSPNIFNRVTGIAMIVPITSGGAFARRTGYAVSLMAAGTKTTGVIRCDQLRTIDVLARQGRFLESAPNEIVEEVLARLTSLFQ